jgi:hypothetical protein
MNIKEGDIARWNPTYASANGDDSPGPIKNKASTVRGGQSIMYVSEKGSSTHEKECRITVAKHGSGPVSLRKSTSQVGGLGKHKNSVADAVKDSKFSTKKSNV